MFKPARKMDEYYFRQAPPARAADESSRGAERTSYVVPADEPVTPRNSGAIDSKVEFDENDESWLEKTLESMSPKRLTAGFKKMIGQGPNQDLAEQVYAEGDRLFHEKNYAEAAKRYKAACKRWPDSDLEQNGMFMLAECYFFMDRYPKASDAYANLLKKYENSWHTDTVSRRHFAIARYWDERTLGKKKSLFNFSDKSLPFMDPSGNAVAIYQSIQLNDPRGPLADDATMAAANSHFVRGRYDDAGYQYDLLRKSYSDSDHVPQATVLGMQAKMRSYQGPQYDSAPLNDADTMVEQAMSMAVAEDLESRENMLDTRRRIREMKAERQFESGEYYFRRKYYRAARYWYAKLLNEFPDTSFALRAEDRMAETKDLPPVPPNRFQWLVNLFPKSKKY